jgi:exopolysaccharide biosynthesis polyprenyl glycosylphosphotransferase
MAVAVDAAAVFGGFMLAVWVRLDTGWIPVFKNKLPPADYHRLYAAGAAFAVLAFLLVFRSLGLFVRPQTGSFPGKIPRLLKACAAGVILTVVLAYSVLNEFDFSRLVIAIAGVLVFVFVLLERYIMFRIEWNVARHSRVKNDVLILGTDAVAVRLTRTLEREKMLRARVVGFLSTGASDPDASLAPEQIKGNIGSLNQFIEANKVDQIILADSHLDRDRVVEIILLCERNLITFNMVPDLFRIMTSSMDVQSLDDIPLLGIGRWPLDFFWNRVVKRAEDLCGSLLGLLCAAPLIAVAAVVIRRTSPGAAFYRQERCGESGKCFTLYKLRTMRADAENATGPVFTVENDPRATRFGAFLRSWNIDEVPQLWNVLKGEMSLVGPRPERPHFVEKFKEDIGRYMWRHVSKPGMTGWAQINGLRGNTSIEERIKYDLYYLENWSLAFDFKILMKTLFARKNAY